MSGIIGDGCGRSYDSLVVEGAPDLSRLKIDRSVQPHSRASRLPWLILLLLICAGGWIGWKRGWLAPGSGGPAVEIARVQRVGGAAAQSGVAANGYVVARRQAALSTDIQGRLVELPVEEGTRVREGDLVARLDTSQYEASLAHSRRSAEVNVAEVTRAEQEQLRAELQAEGARAGERLAQQAYQRAAALVASGDERAALLEDATAARDQAVAAREAAEAGRRAQDAALAAAQAALATAQAAIREVEVLIEKSSVYAPFDGVITRKNAEIGEVVSAIGATGPNARGAVATLVDFATLEVQVELAQTSLAAARSEAPVLIYLDAFSERAYRGKVRQIWPTADRVKATVDLRCEFLDRDERIPPEMGVRVVFVPDGATDQKPVEILVPERALRRGPTTATFLYDGGFAVRRELTAMEPRPDGLALVGAGLVGGELVILDPPAELRDGDAVQRKEN